MALRSNLALQKTSLSAAQLSRINELIAEWQLLADLSFADLTLWAPMRSDGKSWPRGHLALAHIRPTTAATAFTADPIGREVSWGENPRIDEALSTGEIIRDNLEQSLGEAIIKEEAIPVNFQGEVIAVISRVRNIETMRTPSKLELNYREIANQIYRMISQGSFPIAENHLIEESLPRVGDGLIRLDVEGRISYASPNALSAFSRLGWGSDLVGQRLGEIIESLPKRSGGLREAQEEGWKVAMSGRMMRRREYENDQGVIDLLAIPLLESRLSESRLSESGQSGAIAGKSERVGAFVLAHDVTELRRRERALISKDATIREIHHRVKNNLQTVSALLRLQARRIEDPSASAALEEAVRRVTSIAWVHETLASNAAERVEFDSVVDRIIRSEIDLSLRDSDSPIGYQREGSFEELHAQIATPLAMVLTELIHNAIEHGLAESGSCLTVRSQRALDGRELLIDVIDDGVGISPEFSIEGSSNLGLEIVKTLTENELGGVISFSRNNPGTQVSIRIPLMGKNS